MHTVTEAILLKRINRKLKRKGERLCKVRGNHPELGDYYLLDVNQNIILDSNCDLELVARDLEVLGSEKLAAPVDKQNHGSQYQSHLRGKIRSIQ